RSPGEVDRRRAPVVARARAAGEVVPVLRMAFGTRLRVGAGTDGERVEVELRGHSVESLAGQVAGFGAAVEVVEPEEVRARLALVARELAALYAVSPPDEAGRPRRRA